MVVCAAEPQLDRFKSQELGMLCWAFAKLAYMPAAALVRATLPHVTAWRNPIAQVRWQGKEVTTWCLPGRCGTGKTGATFARCTVRLA